MQTVAVPHRLLTTTDAKLKTIETLLKQISFEEIPFPDGCCKKHDGMRRLEAVLLAWQKEPCHANFLYHTAWQCTSCGIMRGYGAADAADSTCQVCGTGDASAEKLARNGRRRPTASSVGSTDLHPQFTVIGASTPEAREQDIERASLQASSSTDTVKHEHVLALGARTHERMPPTAAPARDAMIKDALRSLNFQVEGDAYKRCCQKHDAVVHAMRLLGRIRAQSCDASFSQYARWQCKTCGVLDDRVPVGGHCSLCESLLSDRTQTKKTSTSSSSVYSIDSQSLRSSSVDL
eukprot:TRINITY_DN46214_c0_g1_i1.p2 TRINITY_DN46214_c0_g1~~TRINITY_DN46214_c0_g1_i1.p2  ORF type:complete len:292 (+),score=39.13 TRINITY_DN46214_c0_g1_i1:264-1139(+)